MATGLDDVVYEHAGLVGANLRSANLMLLPFAKDEMLLKISNKLVNKKPLTYVTWWLQILLNLKGPSSTAPTCSGTSTNPCNLKSVNPKVMA